MRALVQSFVKKSMFAAVLLLPTFAFAASCNSPYGMASTADRDAFKLNPQSILASNPTGGGILARSTRELLLGETDLHNSILTIAPTANVGQQSSLGVGLGQATLACARTNPALAQQISLAVLSKGPKDLVDAFKATLKDVETLSVTNGPAAPATPGLGGVDANGNSGGPEGSTPGVPQKGFAPSSLGFGTDPAANNDSGTPLALASGSPIGNGGTSSPVATVPGPTVGEGPLALLVSGAVIYMIYRRRSKDGMAS